MKEFKFEDVVTVYLGKPGSCMCGCSGDYAYTSANAKLAGKDRGYSIDEDEISDRKVKARLKRFYTDPARPEINPIKKGKKPYIYTKYIDGRQITVYLKKDMK